MCLHTCKIALERKKVDGEFQFVGTGYKVMYGYEAPKFGRWKKAKPWHGIQDREFSTVAKKEYFPGFHIWTTLKGALKYKADNYSLHLYKVTYKEILAFGTNDTYRGVTSPCVVANYICYDYEIDSKGNRID